MVAMRMSDVNTNEILATLGEPVDQILRMLDGQKSINEDGIVLAVNQRNGVRNPSQIFRAWRKSLSDTRTLLRQDLPIQVRHKIVPPLWFRSRRSSRRKWMKHGTCQSIKDPFNGSVAASLRCKSQPTEKRTGSRSASLRADYPRLGILHTPPCFIPRCVLVAIPRGPAYVKIGVRRSSKHDPRARISHRSREAAMRRIKRPKHHPVWPYGNWRACLIEGRVVAMLRGPAEHITQSR